MSPRKPQPEVDSPISTPASPAPQATPLAGRLVGLVVLALGLAGLVWVWGIARVNYETAHVRTLADRAETATQMQAAEQSIRALLERDPSSSELHNRLASLLARRRDYRGALNELALARQTGNAQNGLFLVADMHEKLNERERAAELMGDVLQLNPNNSVFRDAYLRLLNQRYLELVGARQSNQPYDAEELKAVRQRFGREARAWAVRAPHNPNSHLFLGQHYIEPLYALQAYRCYLIGLSESGYFTPGTDLMISQEQLMGTIRQIFSGHAKPYRNLP